MKNLSRLFLVSTLAAPLLGFASTPSDAARRVGGSTHDGTWSVAIYTQRGPCSSVRVAVRIVGGRVYSEDRSSYVPDMLAGHVQLVFSPIPTTIQQVRAGKLRALAVTSATRSQALPDVPTLGEFLPGYDASVWNGVVAPKNTPAEIIEKLYKKIDAALADPEIMARFAEVGSVPKSMTPTDFGKFIAEDTEKWGKVIQAAKISVD